MMPFPLAPHWRAPFISNATLDNALRSVELEEGIQASSRDSFKSALYGRDSVEVGLDVVDHRPDLAERIIRSVARHIGLRDDPDSEEEPGKGFHEFRATVMSGEPVQGEQLERFHQLSAIWGGDDESMTYYGALDTGALYVVLLEKLCNLRGPALLQQEIVHRTGRVLSLAATVEMTADFYCRKIAESDFGLIEFRRRNEDGIWYQVMRDGHDSMILPNGDLANADQPIAAIEIQSVAYSALRAAARLTTDAGRRREWDAAAEDLRSAMFEKLWLADESFFARAIHRRRSDGEPELIETFDTAAIETLRDALFDDLAESEQERYVGGLVRRAFSAHFLVDIGFRTQSTAHLEATDYWRYQGPNTVWPTIVKRIGDGLHRQDLYELGVDVDARLLRACEIARDFPEYFFVADDGTPVYRYDPTKGGTPSPHVPMSIQAWTASAAFGAFHRSTELPGQRSAWKHALIAEIAEQLWTPFHRVLDRVEGTRREHAHYESRGYHVPGVMKALS